MSVRQGSRKADWCTPHGQPRSSCRPDQAHKWAFWVRGDLLAAATRKATEEGISLSKLLNRALERETGFTLPPPQIRGTRVALLPGVNATADGYEVENRDDGTVVLHPASPAGMTAEEFTAEFASLEAARGSMLTVKQELFAARLEAATEERPVTFADLQAATDTGSSNSYVSGLLATVLKAGAVGRRKEGRTVYWWRLPGADIRAAMRGESQEAAVSAQEAPAEVPDHAPPEPAIARMAGSGGMAAEARAPQGSPEEV